MSRRLHIVVAVLVVIAVALFACYLLRPKTYTATAWMQILSRRPYFIFEETERRSYEAIVNTQFALIRSPLILDKALENPDVGKLAIIQRQRDPVAWLAKKLKLERQAHSEMATISISTPDPAASQAIVNAVVDAFFNYYDSEAQAWNSKLISRLMLEQNRQQSAARLLQDEIRAALENAATRVDGRGDPLIASPGDTLLKDIRQAEIKLDTLRAQLKTLQETAEKAPEIPAALLLAEADGDATQVETKRTEIQRTLASRTILELVATTQAVRTQEILIDYLQQRYQGQIRAIGERTVKIVDVSFQQAQLKRIDQVLDRLSNRIVALQTEMNAPAQIQLRKKATLPTNPD